MSHLRRIAKRIDSSTKNTRLLMAVVLSIVLASLTPGRSLAAGSWTFAGSIPSQYLSHVSWWDPMVIDPTNANIIYVPTFDEGLLKSTDGGATWNLISAQQASPLGAAAWHDIAISITRETPLCGVMRAAAFLAATF